MNSNWHVYPDAQAAAQACALRVAELLDSAVAERQLASLAISGGTTPRSMFERLARTGIDWNRVHLFWVDERAAPTDDPRSNYRLAREHLIVPAGIPDRNVHRILAELPPVEAAVRYAAGIREFFNLAAGQMPRFDVIHRGMGADAHTASLFPGEPLISDRREIAAAVLVAKLAQWRVTLLPGVLLAASHTVVLTAGPDKAEAVRSILREPYDPRLYPGQLGHDREVEWFLDDAAATSVKGPVGG